MSLSIRHVVAFFLQFGFWGLALLAIADDSFLFLPIGSDLLTVLLVARHHEQLPICVLAAATGSTIGVLLLDLVCRTGGEEGLRRLLKPKLPVYLQQQMKQRATAVLIVSCLAPPPLPRGCRQSAGTNGRANRARLSSNYPASLNQLDDLCDDGEDQQDVNESTERVRSDQP